MSCLNLVKDSGSDRRDHARQYLGALRIVCFFQQPKSLQTSGHRPTTGRDCRRTPPTCWVPCHQFYGKAATTGYGNFNRPIVKFNDEHTLTHTPLAVAHAVGDVRSCCNSKTWSLESTSTFRGPEVREEPHRSRRYQHAANS